LRSLPEVKAASASRMALRTGSLIDGFAAATPHATAISIEVTKARLIGSALYLMRTSGGGCGFVPAGHCR